MHEYVVSDETQEENDTDTRAHTECGWGITEKRKRKKTLRFRWVADLNIVVPLSFKKHFLSNLIYSNMHLYAQKTLRYINKYLVF